MMKTLRFSLLSMLMMLCGSVMADPIVWVASEQNFSNAEEVASIEIGDVTVTFSKGSNNNAPKYYNTGAAIRTYGGNTFTFTGKTEDVTISEIVFTFATGGGSNEIIASKGSFDTNTWTGSENEIMFTIGGSTGHRRIAQIAVTYTKGGETPVEVTTAAKPVITPNGGNFTESVEVTISSESQTAQLYYKLNDAEEFTLYEAPFTLTESTLVTAYAYDEACDVKQSAEVTAQFNKLVTVKGTCADVIAGEDGTIFRVRGTVTEIVNTKHGNWYLKDETGSVYIYGTLDRDGNTKNFESLGIEVGDTVTVEGPKKTFNETIELVDVTVIEHVKPVTTPEPIETEGDGSEQNPYTVGDLKKMTQNDYPTEKVWVKGIIVGSASSATELNPSENNVASNIAIAATAESLDEFIPVQLPNGSEARTQLNVADNPGNIGKEVSVYGTIELYFKTTGVKNVENFKLEGIATGISTIAQDTQAEVYNLQGQRMTTLKKGINIIAGRKVMVK